MSYDYTLPGYLPELLTGPISVNAEVQAANLRRELSELEDVLAVWQYLNGRWGHVNGLIDAMNDLHARLGSGIEIEKGLE